MTDLSTLIINWTFVTIGAIGFLLQHHLTAGLRMSVFDWLLNVLIVLLAISSLYFAQAAFDLITRMLILDQYPFDNINLYDAFRYQFICALGAIGLFFFHMFQFFWFKTVSTGVER